MLLKPIWASVRAVPTGLLARAAMRQRAWLIHSAVELVGGVADTISSHVSRAQSLATWTKTYVHGQKCTCTDCMPVDPVQCLIGLRGRIHASRPDPFAPIPKVWVKHLPLPLTSWTEQRLCLINISNKNIRLLYNINYNIYMLYNINYNIYTKSSRRKSRIVRATKYKIKMPSKLS